MRRPSHLGSSGPPHTAGAWRRTACRRRGAPAFVVAASLPAFSSSRSDGTSLPRLAAPLLVAAAFFLPFVHAGCAEGLLGGDPTTGLDLQVTRSPIDPVARQDEPNFEPVPGAVAEVRRGGARTRVTTDDEGRIRLSLEPGAYTVEVRECPGALSLPSPAEVRVERGALTSLRLDCDTGIR